MTRRSAEVIYEAMVDRTMKDHFAMVCRGCDTRAAEDTTYCKKCEQVTQKIWKNPGCKINQCSHIEKRTLDMARLMEVGTRISKTKGYIDIPGDDPELLRLLAERLRDYAVKAGKAASAFLRVAETAELHARRGWLHQLAECALDVDEEHLGEE